MSMSHPRVGQWTLAGRTLAMNSSVIRDIVKAAEQPGMISFAGGTPSVKTFPVDECAAASAQVLRDTPYAALQYAPSEGLGRLRELVAQSMPWKVDPSTVLITTGAQQGLDLVSKVLIDAGSRVLVESPTYLGALQSFTVLEPEILAVEGDADGLDTADLQAKASAARFLYVQPNFQNPSGRLMSQDRRLDLCNSAMRLGLPMVEDNPYGELWYDNKPSAPLTSLSPDGCIYLGTFSKVLSPGLRVGYLIAPKGLYPKLLQAKQASDLHCTGLSQRIVAQVIEGGFLDRHVPTIRALYQTQRDAMLEALAGEFPDDSPLRLTWNRPAGGMFIWARLPDGMNALELLPYALSHGVAFVAGSAFYPGQGDPRALRLSFVNPGVEEIRKGIAALAKAMQEYCLALSLLQTAS